MTATDPYVQEFKTAVASSFHFLVSEYGFRSKEVNDWQFVFWSQNCGISVDMEWHELFVAIEPNNNLHSVYQINPRNALALRIIVACLDHDSKYDVKSDLKAEEISFAVERLASMVKYYCNTMVRGDFSMWPSLNACAKEWIKTWELKRKKGR